MADWYWMKNGEKHGPVDTAHLKQLARTGQIEPTDTIWREGLPEWVPARKAKGLFDAGSSQPSQPVSPPAPPAPSMPQESKAVTREPATSPAGDAPRPALPAEDEDKHYWEFIKKLDEPKGIWGSMMAEFQNSGSNGPMPRGPKALMHECQRLASHSRFSITALGMVPADVKQLRARYRTCLMSLEKWAAHYPEYRGDFINLWNETASTLKVAPISNAHFRSPEVASKYGIPVTHTGPEPVPASVAAVSAPTLDPLAVAASPQTARPVDRRGTAFQAPQAPEPSTGIASEEAAQGQADEAASSSPSPAATGHEASWFSKVMRNYKSLPSDQQNKALGCLGCLGVIVVIAVVAGLSSLWSFATSGPGESSYKTIDAMKQDFDRVYSAGSLELGSIVAVKGSQASVYVRMNNSPPDKRVRGPYAESLGWITYDKLTDDLLDKIDSVDEKRDLKITFDGKKVEVSYESYFDAGGYINNATWERKSSSYVLDEEDRK